MNRSFLHHSIKAAVCAAFIFSSHSLFSQGKGGAQGAPLPFWKLTGNAADTSDFFGTTNAVPIIFKTLNLERFRVDANGNIILQNNISLRHSASTAALGFDAFNSSNTIALGYNISNASLLHGVVIVPPGNTLYPNGVIVLSDPNLNGQILLALGTGSSGTRFNLDGAGKRVVLQNDGGDKFIMGGVNAPTLFETTQGISVAPRSGFTFTGTHLFDLQGSINAQQYYLNGNLVDVPKISSDIATLQFSVDSLKQNTGGQWQTNGNNIYYNSGNVGVGTDASAEKLTVAGNLATSGVVFANGGFHTTGTITSGSITTGNLTISDKIFTKSAEIVESVISDTLHALKSLEVNNSLRLSRDTSVMYAEMSTKDTAVALLLQKDLSAPVVIGEALPPPPGESRPKLTVSGNSLINGNLNVSGSVIASVIGNEGTTINAGTISATSFNAAQFSTDSIYVTRILPAVGDSEIHIGESSINVNLIYNRIWGSGLTAGGIALGSSATGYAPSSVAIGANVQSTAASAIAIGSGVNKLNPLNNSIPNSLVIGFNSNLPTVFVSPSGLNSTGNVGIGTTSVNSKLTIAGSTSDNTASSLNVLNSDNASLLFVENDGKTGIGTTAPKEKMQIGDVFTFHDSQFENAVGRNFYRDGTDDKRIVQEPASVIYFSRTKADNGIALMTAEEGAAGSVISWNRGITINSKGQVYMGDETIATGPFASTYKLAVDGLIISKRSKVSVVGWADYVLKKDYALMTLEEVEEFIEKYGYLPGMPSEKEVVEQGLDLGDMSMLHQIKIEEIIKYIIKQDKEIKYLKGRVAEQDKKIEELEKKK